MNDTIETLYLIADSIRETGNDPHDQLLGYITTGDVTYITRRNNARALIQTVDKKDVKQFVKELKRVSKLSKDKYSCGFASALIVPKPC